MSDAAPRVGSEQWRAEMVERLRREMKRVSVRHRRRREKSDTSAGVRARLVSGDRVPQDRGVQS